MATVEQGTEAHIAQGRLDGDIRGIRSGQSEVVGPGALNQKPFLAQPAKPEAARRLAEQVDITGIRCQKSCQEMEQGRFPAAGRASQGNHFAFADGQREITQHLLTRPEALADGTQLDPVFRALHRHGFTRALKVYRGCQPLKNFGTSTHRCGTIMIMLGKGAQRLEKLRGQ